MTHLQLAHTPFDILVKNFFEQDSQFDKVNHRAVNHPVDIWENDEGLTLEVACVGLIKTDVELDIEDAGTKSLKNISDSFQTFGIAPSGDKVIKTDGLKEFFLSDKNIIGRYLAEDIINERRIFRLSSS